MALNSSGPISLGGATTGQSINLELGQSATATTSLNATNVRTLAGVASGAITMPTDFWGKSNLFSFTLGAGTDVNLRNAAITAGWPGSGAVQATINSGTTIQSSSTGSYALTINGAWPGGVTLNNNGTVIGRGGDGGTGGISTNSPGGPSDGVPGGAGGTAILVSVPATINNAGGVISGGGGGGGGGGGQSTSSRSRSSGGGGGGGIGVSLGGAGGTGSSGPSGGGPGTPGTAGTLTAFGTGGAEGPHPGSSLSGGVGGNGGSYGSSGSPGSYPGSSRTPGSGGGAGNAVSGNSFVTWPALGTIYGARV